MTSLAARAEAIARPGPAGVQRAGTLTSRNTIPQPGARQIATHRHQLRETGTATQMPKPPGTGSELGRGAVRRRANPMAVPRWRHHGRRNRAATRAAAGKELLQLARA